MGTDDVPGVIRIQLAISKADQRMLQSKGAHIAQSLDPAPAPLPLL